MKRIIGTILLTLVLCVGFAALACADASGDGWSLIGTTLTVTSDTPMSIDEPYDGDGYPWAYWKVNVKVEHVIIQDGVTLIGDYAFREFDQLKSVSIPDSVVKIEDYAFSKCAQLKHVKIPDSVQSIGTYAFYRCGLTDVEIPASVTAIGTQAFGECAALSSALYKGTTVLSDVYAFWECPLLTTVMVPQEYNSGTFCKKPVTVVYTVTIADDMEYGTMTADQYFAAEGETITLIPQPDPGYELVSYNVIHDDNHNQYVDVQNGTFVMPTANVTAKAFFRLIPNISMQMDKTVYHESDKDGAGITFSFVGLTGGTIALYIDGTAVGTTWTHHDDTMPTMQTACSLKNLNLTEGIHHAYVVYDPYDGSMGNVKSNEISFEWVLSRRVTLSKSPDEGGMVSGGGVYKRGAAAAAYATTNKGFTFDGWYENGNLVSSEEAYLFNADENRELVAKWTEKDDTPYTIEYYEMDTNGQYPENASHTVMMTGKTLQQVSADTTAPEGFTFDAGNANNVIEGYIAGDGNMVLRVYFSRNQYQITFDTDGGNQVAPITQKYGSLVNTPANPEKKGYVFLGWQDENGNMVSFPLEMPMNGLALKAVWTKAAALPQTGDHAHPALWMLLLGASAVLLQTMRRRREN